MLTADQRARHARHLLLPDVGEAGQAKLCAARVCAAVDADPRAVAVAQDYLARAGLTPHAQGTPVQPGSPQAVDALAGTPALREPAAALAGAFAAVETIKATLGVGRPATLPADFSLND